MPSTFYSTPSGLIVEIVDPSQVADASWTALTETAYNSAFDALVAVKGTARDADLLARKAVYDNLKASRHTDDWTEATVQAVSRYTPPAV